MTKEELKQMDDLFKNTEELKEKIAFLKDKLHDCTSKVKEIDIQTNRNLESAQDKVIPELEAAIEKLNEKCTEWAKKLVGIYNAIEVLDEREKRLIILKYVDQLKWEEVCCKMNYGWTHIHRIHASALRKLEHGTQWDT
jgi:DNA-directed RNA polymerase specialized sigma subunit